jgi:putative flippase GtrA
MTRRGEPAAVPHPAPRFALVGVTNFFVSLAVFYVCYRLLVAGYVPGLRNQAREPAAIANVVAYIAGMVNSFIWNRSWTFRARGKVLPQAVRFTVVNLVSLVLGTWAMHAFVDQRGLPEMAVFLPLAVVITLLNYYGSKLWAFAQPASASEQRA